MPGPSPSATTSSPAAGAVRARGLPWRDLRPRCVRCTPVVGSPGRPRWPPRWRPVAGLRPRSRSPARPAPGWAPRRRRHRRQRRDPRRRADVEGRRRLVAVAGRREAEPRRRPAGCSRSGPTRARASRSTAPAPTACRSSGSTGTAAAVSWAWPATSGSRCPRAARARSTPPWSSAARRPSCRRSRTPRACRSRATSLTGFARLHAGSSTTQGGLPIVIPQTVVASHAKASSSRPARPQTLTGTAGARLRPRAQDAARRRLRPVRHQGEVILAAAVKAKLAGPIAHPGAADELQQGRADQPVGRAGPHLRRRRCTSLNPRKVGRRRRQGRLRRGPGGQSIVVLGGRGPQPLRRLPRREPLVTSRAPAHPSRDPARPHRPTSAPSGPSWRRSPSRRVLVGKEAVTYFESLQEFRVAELDGRVVGCGALHVMWEDLAEVRTLAVRRDAARHAASAARLLEALLEDAARPRRRAALLPDLRGRLLRPARLRRDRGPGRPAGRLRRAAALLRRGRRRVPRPRAGQAQHPGQHPDAAHPLTRHPRHQWAALRRFCAVVGADRSQGGRLRPRVGGSAGSAQARPDAA